MNKRKREELERKTDAGLDRVIEREKKRRAADEMLGISEVENNGTVTLPDRVLEILKLKPGDKVGLDPNDDHSITVTKA